MKIECRTVLITGGTSGIGFALAKALLHRDNTVIITGRDQEKLTATEKALPGVHTVRSDVSGPDAVIALHDDVLRRFPALDTLVNNAGIMRNLDLNQRHGVTDVTREIDINLSGPIRMIEQFLPHLKTRKDALIVNVTSGLAFVPFPLSPVYSAAKAGLHAYTRCLRVQLEGTFVALVELAPPGTETPLLRREFAAEMASQKGMDVSALAARAISGIEAGRSEIRPGLSNVLKIASRVAPNFMFSQMAKVGKPKASRA